LERADQAQRRTQQSSFYRNASLLGAALALFASFSVVGSGRFAITGSLLNLRWASFRDGVTLTPF
jgi:hypothetical protein